MAQRAVEAFSFDDRNVPVVVRTDALYADDHPYVTRFPGKFEPADDRAIESPVRAVETATAAPGARRTISRGARGDGKPDRPDGQG